FKIYRDNTDIHSIPTRRSSDLPKVDVLFGGGRKYFVRDDRNIAQEFEAAGYQYITELEALQDVKQLPALGLFADDGMTSALNSRSEEHTSELQSRENLVCRLLL